LRVQTPPWEKKGPTAGRSFSETTIQEKRPHIATGRAWPQNIEIFFLDEDADLFKEDFIKWR